MVSLVVHVTIVKPLISHVSVEPAVRAPYLGAVEGHHTVQAVELDK